MKKFGFTLAEVLITLMIIGVIAAVTLPALNANTAAAQVGPKLTKAVSSFEQANRALLNDYSVDALSDTGILTTAAYRNALADHLNLSSITSTNLPNTTQATGSCSGVGNLASAKTNGTAFITKDGILYYFAIGSLNNLGQRPHRERIGEVFIDINGVSKPNVMSMDVFMFSWWNDGTLKPAGIADWNSFNGGVDSNCSWRSHCANNAVPTNGASCTGSIFENNYKVLYKPII